MKGVIKHLKIIWEMVGNTKTIAEEINKTSRRDLPPCEEKLALKLIQNGSKGVTWDDFSTGYAIRSRVSDLKDRGYNIIAHHETLSGGGWRSRYVLHGGSNATH